MEPKSGHFNDLQYMSSRGFWLHYSTLIYSPWKSRNKSSCQQHTGDIQVGRYDGTEKQISNHSGNPCQEDQGKRSIPLILVGKEGHINLLSVSIHSLLAWNPPAASLTNLSARSFLQSLEEFVWRLFFWRTSIHTTAVFKGKA